MAFSTILPALRTVVGRPRQAITRTVAQKRSFHDNVALEPSTGAMVKKITRKKEDDGTITIEGKYTEVVQRPDKLVLKKQGCCPMCSLDLPVHYTDVLILKQFLRKDGSLLPRRDTGLCARQQVNMARLVHKAANAGLLSSYHPALAEGQVKKPAKDSKFKFKGFNRYFTDKY